MDMVEHHTRADLVSKIASSNCCDCYAAELDYDLCFNNIKLKLIQVYQIVFVILGATANGFVIYASKQYSTFNLDSNTIFLVRHLCYADVGILVLGFLPANFPQYLHSSNGAENHFCTAQGCALNIFGLIALVITAGISVHRLLRCTYPQAVAQVRRGFMLILVLIIYIFAVSVTLLVKFGLGVKYGYSVDYFSCTVEFDNKLSSMTTNQEGFQTRASRSANLSILGMCLMGVFFVVIVTINVLLNYYSKKKLKTLSGSVQKQKRSRYRTLMTHSITALLIVTWLPFATVFLLNTMEPPEKRYKWQPISQFVINFYLLNFVGNPVLYCITNINFMKFAVKLIRRQFKTAYIKVRKKLNPDFDLSAISAMDPSQFPFSSGMEERSQVIVERVYNNMLTIPAQNELKKGTARKTDSSAHSSSVLSVPDIVPCNRPASPQPNSTTKKTSKGKLLLKSGKYLIKKTVNVECGKKNKTRVDHPDTSEHEPNHKIEIIIIGTRNGSRE